MTVGVLWGAGDRAELVEAGADHIVTLPDELEALV
jgi:phosphoglycolate phosphatase-like HAD superfamily hydrolase